MAASISEGSDTRSPVAPSSTIFMPIRIDRHLTARKLVPRIERLFDLSAAKILSIEKTWNPSKGTPVFTAKGKYTSKGWTEWTQGFQFGSALLQFDATGDERFLEIGRSRTIEVMAPHVSHMGVHDHGFNNTLHLREPLAADARGQDPLQRARERLL